MKDKDPQLNRLMEIEGPLLLASVISVCGMKTATQVMDHYTQFIAARCSTPEDN